MVGGRRRHRAHLDTGGVRPSVTAPAEDIEFEERATIAPEDEEVVKVCDCPDEVLDEHLVADKERDT